jgi:hypothetical protein
MKSTDAVIVAAAAKKRDMEETTANNAPSSTPQHSAPRKSHTARPCREHVAPGMDPRALEAKAPKTIWAFQPCVFRRIVVVYAVKGQHRKLNYLFLVYPPAFYPLILGSNSFYTNSRKKSPCLVISYEK